MNLSDRIFDIYFSVIVVVLGCGAIFVAGMAIKYGIKRVLRRLVIPVRVRELAKTLTLTTSDTFIFPSKKNIVEDALAGLLLDGRVNNSPFGVARNMAIDCLVMIDCWGREIHRGYVDLYTTDYSTQPLSFTRKLMSLEEFPETSGEELGTLIHVAAASFSYVVTKHEGLFLAGYVDEGIKAWLGGWREWGGLGSIRKKPPPLPLFEKEVFNYYGDNGKDLADLFDCWHRFYSNDGLLNRKGRKGLQEFIERLGRRNFTTEITRFVSKDSFGRGQT